MWTVDTQHHITSSHELRNGQPTSIVWAYYIRKSGPSKIIFLWKSRNRNVLKKGSKQKDVTEVIAVEEYLDLPLKMKGSVRKDMMQLVLDESIGMR